MLAYLKTTETCNLNCRHCFTSGSKGPKIYWNVDATIDWIKRLNQYKPNLNQIHFEFHGGEPFLVPVEQMRKVFDECDGLWSNMSWGATTNLVYSLTDDILDFIKGPLDNRIGTSWDPKIRFANQKQNDLWAKNVKRLVGDGVTVKLFISVTKDTINIEPIELLKFVRDLGVKEMSLERLTNNGTAKMFSEIFPSNLEQDSWFLKMHEQSLQYNTREWFDNEFLETVYDKFEKGIIQAGTFCRDCEEKLFTLNADGTIAGCPNSAPEDHYGNIKMSMEELFTVPKRTEIIACERSRDPRCYDCEVFQYCGGDCHQLSWENDICGAPKSLMMRLAGINSGRKEVKPKKIIRIKEI